MTPMADQEMMKAKLAATFPELAGRAKRVREATDKWNAALATAANLLTAAAAELQATEKEAVDAGLTLKWRELDSARGETAVRYLDSLKHIPDIVLFATL
jgi:hypothetical protein